MFSNQRTFFTARKTHCHFEPSMCSLLFPLLLPGKVVPKLHIHQTFCGFTESRRKKKNWEWKKRWRRAELFVTFSPERRKSCTWYTTEEGAARFWQVVQFLWAKLHVEQRGRMPEPWARAHELYGTLCVGFFENRNVDHQIWPWTMGNAHFFQVEEVRLHQVDLEFWDSCADAMSVDDSTTC